jgi:hypothetical protein
MRLFLAFGTSFFIGAFCLCAQGPNTPAKDPQTNEARGVPPRAAPGDYQAHATAGTVTIGAEFLGHSIPRPEGAPLTNEDYVVVEIGFFGPAEARLKLSVGDFSLRVNEKKVASPAQPFGVLFRSLKDPDWEDANAVEMKEKEKSSTSISTGGQQAQGKEPPAPVHMPLPLQRAINQHAQRVSLPEGDRPLPQAGLIFFPHRGKVENIHSLELTYDGPAGKATMMLEP